LRALQFDSTTFFHEHQIEARNSQPKRSAVSSQIETPRSKRTFIAKGFPELMNSMVGVKPTPRFVFRLSFQVILLMLVFLFLYLEGFIDERILAGSLGTLFAPDRAPVNFVVRFGTEILLALSLGFAVLRSRTRNDDTMLYTGALSKFIGVAD
jgi:hypothetical protein